MSANDTQIGGEHYKTKSIQPWDFISSNGLGYLEGCVVKYVTRHADKGGLQDLQKAAHYIQKLIEINAEPVAVAKVVAAATPVRRRGRPPGIKNKRKVTK
jgi:hypothetical protein